MRGEKQPQLTMLSLQKPEELVPKDHPLRFVKALADAALWELNKTFDQMYSKKGRPSIPPERLLKATLLMAFFTVRSERLFCEQLAYNMLFRWFLDMDMAEQTFDHSTFSQNRKRLLDHDVAGKFFAEVVEQARAKGLMSDEHFTVDGTLVEAWASLKSFRPKDEKGGKNPPDDPGNPTVDFHGEKRSNDTHESKTDPEAKLARKGNGKEAKLSYSQNVLMENRNGLIIDTLVAKATGFAERETALEMLDRSLPGKRRITLGGDKGYDVAQFVDDCRARNVTPHVAAKDTTKLDARTLRHVGYRISQVVRKRVEEIFGWTKTVGNFRKTRYRGTQRNQAAAFMVGAAYNLLRIARLETA
jgi:transposase